MVVSQAQAVAARSGRLCWFSLTAQVSRWRTSLSAVSQESQTSTS